MDLDRPSEFKKLVSYLRCRRVADSYGSGFKYVKSGRKGDPHFVVYGLPVYDPYLRGLFFDDPMRIVFDTRNCGKPSQVLYKVRDGKCREEGDERSLLSLPWWSRNPKRGPGRC